MNQIIKYLLDMMPYMLTAVPAALLYRVIAVKGLKSKGKQTTVYHEAGLVVFLLFLVGLASQTIIPKPDAGLYRTEISGYYSTDVNLIPFQVFVDTYNIVFAYRYIDYFIINFLGNIVMFMPVGFFLPLLWDKASLKKTVLIGFFSSLFIELCQLPFVRGTDIDDLWMNTLGVLLGFWIYRSVNKSSPSFTAKFKVRQGQTGVESR
jgi:glycopeptide antibiotics resistance protein